MNLKKAITRNNEIKVCSNNHKADKKTFSSIGDIFGCHLRISSQILSVLSLLAACSKTAGRYCANCCRWLSLLRLFLYPCLIVCCICFTIICQIEHSFLCPNYGICSYQILAFYFCVPRLLQCPKYGIHSSCQTPALCALRLFQCLTYMIRSYCSHSNGVA